MNDIVERVERVKSANDSYIYYGQINAKGQMHGLGAMLFKNGFCYQGMFSNGFREGLGITYDITGSKYKGEHKAGIREGKGVFKSNDNKIYEGGWSNNKMHGRGREKFINGDCFLVYYKNGYRIDALASKKKNLALSPNSNFSLALKNSLDDSTVVTLSGQRTAKLNLSYDDSYKASKKGKIIARMTEAESPRCQTPTLLSNRKK